MRNLEIWQKELVSEIRTIADQSELRRLWSGVDPQSISSFAEEVAHIFDDYDIDGFIAVGVGKGTLTPKQTDALRTFRDRFSAYLDSLAPKALTSIGYEMVLSDPQWIGVTRAAREFIALVDAGRD